MRPVVVTAVLLLVVLMSMSDSAEWTPDLMCRTKYPVVWCNKAYLGHGWLQFGPDRCMRVIDRKVNFDEAKKSCRKHEKGDLVSIHSLDELHQVECLMYRFSTMRMNYWIGLFRGRKGFVWTDGSNASYSHYARGQPDNYWWQEHCGEMNYKGWGLWNDVSCLAYRPFVCQATI